MMPEESTILDLLERRREANEDFARRDFDAMMSFVAPRFETVLQRCRYDRALARPAL
jgi:hypothetical protein